MDKSKNLSVNEKDLMFSNQLDLFFTNKKESELLLEIQNRVHELLEHDPALLFSYLYRLDIDEEKLQHILHNPQQSSIVESIAQEILSRQMIRLKHKKEIIVPPIDQGWEW